MAAPCGVVFSPSDKNLPTPCHNAMLQRSASSLRTREFLGGAWTRLLPVSFFSVVLGLAGFALALQRTEAVLGLELGADVVLAAACMVFLGLSAAYGVKLVKFPEAVAGEFNHPVMLSFFPTISIGLILLGIGIFPFSPLLCLWVWAIGSVLQLCFTLFILSRWIVHTGFEIHHLNPSWFIPVVGNILVPAGGTIHGLMEISWFFFSVGLLFWIVLLTIIFYRVIFHAPLSERLMPTLFILVAPPAVGFVSYVGLIESIDNFARILFYIALFLVLLLLMLHRKFMNIRFFLSWWAYSFPIAAFTIASLTMYAHTKAPFYLALSAGSLVFLAATIAVLMMRTFRALLRREIFVEE